MLNRRTFVLATGASFCYRPTFAKAERPSIGAVSELLAKATNQSHACTGMIAAICDSKKQRITSYGRSDALNGRALDGDTIFDIGSLTKLFTALTLADMVIRGEVRMEDPLAKYLPQEIAVPTFEGKAITLLDIATYSPGLPGWPANLPPLSADKPFPMYSTDELYKALSNTKLEAAPGSHYVYSNFGYGLLALALARRSNMDFESLVVSRICNPLGMESTRVTLTPAMEARVSPGHNQNLARVTSWNMGDAFAGAGAFRSTASDLMKFIMAAMGLKPSFLAPAFAEMMRPRRPSDMPDTQVAAGWFVTEGHADNLIWKDGGVLGYASFLGYSAIEGRGVVILANGIMGLIDLGKHLLNPSFPLKE